MRKNRNTFFISTAIPYVNANPHIGHALEFVQTDVIARYHRLRGKDVFFLSGTDESALKNVQAAVVAGLPIDKFVNRHAEAFKKLFKWLNISNDDFIRTSVDNRHKLGANKLWLSLKKEDIYKKSYKGLYCIGCEEFKTEKDLVMNGKCPDHPNVSPELVEEENYFFKLSNYQSNIINVLESGQLNVIPGSRKNEVLSFVKSGLEDLSISRSSKRMRGWGLPVPGDSSQTQYVWVEALSNYITALDYGTDGEKFNKYWQNASHVIHVVGKGIIRFHAVYWPALLLSAGIRLPSEIFVHGYITVNGQKISKSLGNVVDPFAIIDKYGTDILRYYLLRHSNSFEDSDFNMERFREAYNANLANGLGNLVSRVLKMGEQNEVTYNLQPTTYNEEKKYGEAIKRYDLRAAMDFVWEKIQAADKKIQATEPFKLVKTEPEKAKRIIGELLSELTEIAELLLPFLPETAEKILGLIKIGHAPATPLFPRKN